MKKNSFYFIPSRHYFWLDSIYYEQNMVIVTSLTQFLSDRNFYFKNFQGTLKYWNLCFRGFEIFLPDQSYHNWWWHTQCHLQLDQHYEWQLWDESTIQLPLPTIQVAFGGNILVVKAETEKRQLKFLFYIIVWILY